MLLHSIQLHTKDRDRKEQQLLTKRVIGDNDDTAQLHSHESSSLSFASSCLATSTLLSPSSDPGDMPASPGEQICCAFCSIGTGAAGAGTEALLGALPAAAAAVVFVDSPLLLAADAPVELIAAVEGALSRR